MMNYLPCDNANFYEVACLFHGQRFVHHTHTSTHSSLPPLPLPQLNISAFAHLQWNGVVDGTED